MTSCPGRTIWPRGGVRAPFTVTLPAAIRLSAFRRAATPAIARKRLRRIASGTASSVRIDLGRVLGGGLVGRPVRAGLVAGGDPAANPPQGPHPANAQHPQEPHRGAPQPPRAASP